jgi:hypothetical protein
VSISLLNTDKTNSVKKALNPTPTVSPIVKKIPASDVSSSTTSSDLSESDLDIDDVDLDDKAYNETLVEHNITKIEQVSSSIKNVERNLKRCAKCIKFFYNKKINEYQI